MNTTMKGDTKIRLVKTITKERKINKKMIMDTKTPLEKTINDETNLQKASNRILITPSNTIKPQVTRKQI